MSGETSDSDYSGAREASPEEREFHALQTSGGRPESQEHSGGESAPSSEPRGDQPREQRAEPPREQYSEPREPRSEPPREHHDSGTQAPLDLPPPPQAKPFVVWSSSPPPGSGTTPRRDE